MKQRIITILSICCLLFHGCYVYDSYYRRMMWNFNEFKSDISKQLLPYLPNDSEFKNMNHATDAHCIAFPAGIYSTNFCYFIFIKKYTSEDFIDKFESIKSTGIKIDTDLCVRYLPEKPNRSGLYMKEPALSNDSTIPTVNTSYSECYDKTIPNIKGNTLLSEYYALTDSIEYYIQHFGEGKFLSKKYDDYYAARKDLHHGFTSGVVVERSTYRIVYWLLIW